MKCFLQSNALLAITRLHVFHPVGQKPAGIEGERCQASRMVGEAASDSYYFLQKRIGRRIHFWNEDC